MEFIYDAEADDFYFLEVNTRLQVEHCVTEEVFAVDLVEWMIRQAAGNWALPSQDSLYQNGCAIQARLYAENPARGFRPSSGRLTEVAFPNTVRVDTWIETGTDVSPYYDPLLAKIIARGDTRAQTIAALHTALTATVVWGIDTNLSYLREIVTTPAFSAAEMHTGLLAALTPPTSTIEVLKPGTQSSLQDLPGRLGYWDVGVPPSGPMDDLSFRLVNRLLGNEETAAALELTFSGPTLRFECDTSFALGGAAMVATLDGVPLKLWTVTTAQAGQVLAIGRIAGPGSRSYLGVRHGFDGPVYLGSRSTFALGGFGGHATGCLRTGDTLHIAAIGATSDIGTSLPPEAQPKLTHTWAIAVIAGPHSTPDFFQASAIDTLFSTEYEVHYNAARTGVRLIGPKPAWARTDGGEAGLHPSNLHDNAYAIGSINFTGDMPILLGPDGPSLGGFVCPAVVADDEKWKLGQLAPGDKIRFFPRIAAPTILRVGADSTGAIMARTDGHTPVCYRRAGDSYMLVEYGAPVLDITLRLRVQLLLLRLQQSGPPGIVDLTPGVRSLQIHFDPALLSADRLLDTLLHIEHDLGSTEDAVLPSRIVHLPLSWNDPQIALAIRRYDETVRADAPWCPSNIEFIRRINGLASVDDVRRIVFDANYLVLGLGDVYLGAPAATPLDPRHRLVTTKYNPARPWTPENAVGIGGAYMCIYGMESPGGYQLVGRTIQIWNSYRRTTAFTKHTLLRFFDQIKYFPVSPAELLDARAAFPHGSYNIKIEETEFSARRYTTFLAENAASIASFRTTREAAFAAEREAWAVTGLDQPVADPADAPPVQTSLPPNALMVESPIAGNLWKLLVQLGDQVQAGDTIAILEAMKTEIRVLAPAAGHIHELLCKPGRDVRAGQPLATLTSAAVA